MCSRAPRKRPNFRESPKGEVRRIPIRNCLKRGSGDAPGVYLASVSGPKWAEGDGLGTLCARVSGASGTFQTVSPRTWVNPQKAKFAEFIFQRLSEKGYEQRSEREF